MPRLFTGHDPAHGLGGQYCQISRVELGRAKIFSNYHGSGWAGSGRVGSGRVGSGRVGSGRVGSGRVGSGRVGLGQEIFKLHELDRATLTRPGPRELTRPVKIPWLSRSSPHYYDIIHMYSYAKTIDIWCWISSCNGPAVKFESLYNCTHVF